MDRTVGQHVSARLNAVHAQRLEYFSPPARRKLAQHITARGIYVGLVEGHPEAAKVANRIRHLSGEALKQPGSIRLKKCSFFFEPARIGEVMQTNDGLNASLVQPFQHLAVTLQRLRVKAALFRFDSAPFERQP